MAIVGAAGAPEPSVTVVAACGWSQVTPGGAALD